MKAKFFLPVLALGLTLLITGCAEVPQAEIDAAKMAVDNAKSSGAEKYVPEEITALQDSLKAAEAEIEKEKSKFMFQNYDNAKKRLEMVKTMSATAMANAETKKAQLKKEAEDGAASVKTMMDENRTLFDTAPTGKDGKEALEAIKAELDMVDASLGEANSMIAAEDYIGAKDKVNAAMQKASSINAELKAVIEKAGPKKGKK